MGRMRNRNTFLKVTLNTMSRAVRLYINSRSLRVWMQPLNYIYRKLRGYSPPVTCIFAVTSRCQCSCPHCCAAAENTHSKEMSTRKALDLIDQVKALGALQIMFTGGEPLLRRDIFDLIAYANKAGLLTRISTNGALLTRENVAELKRAGLNQCGVSIDDADPETHDRLRGVPGLFEKATQGLRYAREYGIVGKLNTYACHDNIIDGLERIIQLGKKLQVSTVYISYPIAVGRWADSPHEVLSKEEMVRLRGLYDYGLVHMEFPTAKTMCCAYNNSILHINKIGAVTPCPVVPYSIGDLREEPLASIWRQHTSVLRLEYRGGCPMNDEAARKALLTHTTSILGQAPKIV